MIVCAHGCRLSLFDGGRLRRSCHRFRSMQNHWISPPAADGIDEIITADTGPNSVPLCCSGESPTLRRVLVHIETAREARQPALCHRLGYVPSNGVVLLEGSSAPKRPGPFWLDGLCNFASPP